MKKTVPDLMNVRDLEQARTLLQPIRVAILRRLRAPGTCQHLATALGMTPQRVNHHVKALKQAGLVRAVREERVRNMIRTTYQAVAKVVWLSPTLTRDPAANEIAERDRMSLNALLGMAEDVQADVAGLLSEATTEVPSLGLSVEVRLADEDARKVFAQEVLDALTPVIAKYQGSEAGSEASYQLKLMVYPMELPHE